jgi:hypothetical protein
MEDTQERDEEPAGGTAAPIPGTTDSTDSTDTAAAEATA